MTTIDSYVMWNSVLESRFFNSQVEVHCIYQPGWIMRYLLTIISLLRKHPHLMKTVCGISLKEDINVQPHASVSKRRNNSPHFLNTTKTFSYVPLQASTSVMKVGFFKGKNPNPWWFGSNISLKSPHHHHFLLIDY